MRYYICVQTNTIYASDSRPPRPSELRDRVLTAMTRAERRATFATALRNGATITEAAKVVGITRPTGSIWAKEIRAANQIDASRSAIISKNQLAETLSKLVQDGNVDPRDRINAGKAAAEVLGYNAPTRSQVEVRQIPASVSAWLDSLDADAIDVTPEPALPSAPGQARLCAPADQPMRPESSGQQAVAEGAGGAPNVTSSVPINPPPNISKIVATGPKGQDGSGDV